MTDMEYNQNVFLQLPPVFTTADISTLEVAQVAPNRNRVIVNPTPAGVARLKAATSGNAGQHIAFVLNGGLQQLVYFRAPIDGPFTLNGHPNGMFSAGALGRVVK